MNLQPITETLRFEAEFNKAIIGCSDNPAKIIGDELELKVIK